MRIVLDTNIIVSGILSPSGAARALLDLARSRTIEVVISAVLLDELEEVLTRFVPRAAAGEIRTVVEEMAATVEPMHVPAVSRDRDDDHVLAAAVAGQAAYVITRDRDLLVLGEHEGIRIVEPASALHTIRAWAEHGDAC